MARTTLAAMENISLVMAGAQLGITVCSLGLGAVGEPAVAHLLEPVLHDVGVPDVLLHPIAFSIALAIVVPKNIAIAGPERAALVLGPPMMAIVTVLRPLIAAINAIANAILRLLRIEPKDEVSSSYTREEVAALVEQSRGEGLLAPNEYSRLSGALGFTVKTTAAVLMPIDTLTTVPVEASGGDIEDLCAATGYSRFPVAQDNKLLGYLHIKDVLETDEPSRRRAIDASSVRPFAAVRANDTLHHTLESLQHRGAHMAKVLDDDGVVLGLATLEDVLEELVGEIRDAAHHHEPR